MSYTIEPHGDAHALYLGRDARHHGLRLCNLSDMDAGVAETILNALNGSSSAVLSASPTAVDEHSDLREVGRETPFLTPESVASGPYAGIVNFIAGEIRARDDRIRDLEAETQRTREALSILTTATADLEIGDEEGDERVVVRNVVAGIRDLRAKLDQSRKRERTLYKEGVEATTVAADTIARLKAELADAKASLAALSAAHPRPTESGGLPGPDYRVSRFGGV
jgi:hypothetical protein